MRKTSLSLVILAWSFALLPIAAQSAGDSQEPPAVPQQAQIINLNLLNALIAIKAQDLAGVFGFVPEAAAAPALADYLLRNPKGLKRFVKKSEKDIKEVGGVNEWDRQVFMYMLTILSSGILPPEAQAASKKWNARISALSISPALPLSEMTLRRKS